MNDAMFEEASKATDDAINHFISDMAMEAARKAAYDVASAEVSAERYFTVFEAAWDRERNAVWRAVVH